MVFKTIAVFCLIFGSLMAGADDFSLLNGSWIYETGPRAGSRLTVQGREIDVEGLGAGTIEAYAGIGTSIEGKSNLRVKFNSLSCFLYATPLLDGRIEFQAVGPTWAECSMRGLIKRVQ